MAAHENHKRVKQLLQISCAHSMYTVAPFPNQYLEKSDSSSSIKCSFVGIKGTAQVSNTKQVYSYHTKQPPLQKKPVITQSLYLLSIFLPEKYHTDLDRLKPYNQFFQINVSRQISSIAYFLTLQLGYK